MYVLSGSTSPRLAGMLAQELEAEYIPANPQLNFSDPDGRRLKEEGRRQLGKARPLETVITTILEVLGHGEGCYTL